MKPNRILLIVAALAFTYALLGNYIALPGYLRFLERGGQSATSNGMDIEFLIGATRTIAWMLSFNIGAACLYLLAVREKAYESRHLGLVIVVCWIAFWVVPELPRMHFSFYVVFGSWILVMVYFCAVNITRQEAQETSNSFLFVTAIYFFAIATWEVCGLGSAGRILEPDQVVLDRSQTLLVTQSTKLMIAMVLAWSCLALSLRRRPVESLL